MDSTLLAPPVALDDIEVEFTGTDLDDGSALDVDDELLVEEISIDGMCGVY
jgi:mycofactocin precursor